MTKRYSICWSDDELTFQAPDDAPSLSVEKRGASGALGQLFSRRFVVLDQQGKELFQVVNGNSGTYPRASLVFDGKEELVLTAGRSNFRTMCNVAGGPCGFLGDPFSNRSKLRWAGHVFALLTLRGAKARRPTCLPLQTVTIFCRCLRRWQRWRCSAEGLFPAWALRADNCSVPIHAALDCTRSSSKLLLPAAYNLVDSKLRRRRWVWLKTRKRGLRRRSCTWW